MARRIKDYSIKSYRSGDNPFIENICTDLEERYCFKKPENSDNLALRLEQAFRFYEAEKFTSHRKPSPSDTREAYDYIKHLSYELHHTLDKLSLAQRLTLSRMKVEGFNLEDLDKTEAYLKKLEKLSFIASLESKGAPSPPHKNSSLEFFCSNVAEIYRLFTAHRNSKKGIRKESFCIECFDLAKIDFRKNNNTADDDNRIKKLLNPTRLPPHKPM